ADLPVHHVEKRHEVRSPGEMLDERPEIPQRAQQLVQIAPRYFLRVGILQEKAVEMSQFFPVRLLRQEPLRLRSQRDSRKTLSLKNQLAAEDAIKIVRQGSQERNRIARRNLVVGQRLARRSGQSAVEKTRYGIRRLPQLVRQGCQIFNVRR